MTREELNRKIAQDLLKIKAVFFRPEEPFTWASGIKSPVYCDNRLTLTAPEVRTDVEKGLAQLIDEEYPGVEVLMGTSTAGIAHAAITAHLMGLPMGYVRSGAKDHGRQNQIEGRLDARIDHLRSCRHLRTLLKYHCIVDRFIRGLAPGERTMVLAQNCRHCFIIVVLERLDDQQTGVLFVSLVQFFLGQIRNVDHASRHYSLHPSSEGLLRNRIRREMSSGRI